LTRDEALAEFAQRYFTSHGPATLQDFTWWSGLTVADARSGIDLVQRQLAKEVIDGMAARNVFIGRIWPVWPTYTRITVGTQDEMAAFQSAFQAVMKNSKTVSLAHPVRPANSRSRRIYADGQLLPGISL